MGVYKIMSKQNIIPGTQKWEDICVRCGLCCLVKYIDNIGRVWLTNVRCDMLNPENGNCGCYSANVDKRDNGHDTCANHHGSVLNFETLNNDYVVPGFCAYVQTFGKHDLVKKCAKRPDINLKDTVPESSVLPQDMQKHIIAGSNKYFKYNPAVNIMMHEQAKAH